MHSPLCPVCQSSRTAPFLTVSDRNYHACPVCEARFLDPRHRPGREEERAQYDLHHNEADDQAYRRFLSRLTGPLLERLNPGSQGLDFGSGPGPTLACMLREAGHLVELYDPFYAPDRSVLSQRHDFVTCSETAEHFHDPAAEFAQLASLLRPGGWLAIMTCFQDDDSRFANWHYRRDPTHVVFYRIHTLQHLAERHGLSCEIPVRNVALMQRPQVPPG